MRLKKWDKILLTSLIFLLFGVSLVPSLKGDLNISNHDHENELQCSYIPCDCGHDTCSGNLATCPCCGFGAPPYGCITSYVKTKGSYYDGEESDTYSNNGEYLTFKNALGWFIFFTHNVRVVFYFFEDYYSTFTIDLEISPNYAGIDRIVAFQVHYDSGPYPDYFYPDDDGYYSYSLNTNKKVTHVVVYWELTDWVDRSPVYVKFDYIRLTEYIP
ncbi:MAG: hypothetical protein ACFE9Z_10735 [Promethearchaeota archaeon]